jgi:hypothetical protein
VTADEALAMLCRTRSIPLDVIRGPSKKTEHYKLRKWIGFELAAAGFNQSEIARAMNKDHSSVCMWFKGGKTRKPMLENAPEPDLLCSCHLQRRQVAW